MLRLCYKYPDTGTHYRLDSFSAKWDRQLCSNGSVIRMCAQDTPVHLRIQGISAWLIMHCILANLICQLKQTRRYWVPVSGYLWHSCSMCCPMVEFPVHQGILGISSWQKQHCMLGNPNCKSKQTGRYQVLVSQYETWAHLLFAKLQILLAYPWICGTPPIRIWESRKLRHCLDMLC